MKKDTQTVYDTFCVARQPILDRNLNTFGYELLYRREVENTDAQIDDPSCATMCVATCGFIRSQESLNQSKRIFVNFTEKLIMEDAPRALPPSVTVIEVLEDILPKPKLLEQIIRLKQDGYLIAIDDYEGTGDKDLLLQMADIIKVDVLHKTPEEIQAIYESIDNRNVLKLAEKVDSKETYEFLYELGFDFFQGFFFARPENLSGRKLTTSQITKIRLLSELNDPSLDTEKLIELVNSDPTIVYRLMRLMNSAAFGFSMKIESVRHAIVLLGNRRLIYWLRMVVLSDFSESDKPNELFMLALNRAKTLEELAENQALGDTRPETVFLLGMLSLLDVMLDSGFPSILKMLPLPDAFQQAYIEESGPFADYLKILNNLETNTPSALQDLSRTTNIDLNQIYNAHIKALLWTDDICNALT